MRFAWFGGYTGVDDHRVAVEMFDGDGYEPARNEEGRPLTDADLETFLDYVPDPDYGTSRFPHARSHRYTFSWETTARVLTGTYRLHIMGTNWNGSAAEPYELYSDSFTIEPSDDVIVADLTVDDLGGGSYRISFQGLLPPNEAGYRVRDPNTPIGDPSPVDGGTASATVNVDGGTPEPVTLTYVGAGVFEANFTKTQAGAHSVSVAAGGLADRFGNTNGEGAGPVAFPD
ncbi:MAG: hypothetical protein M5R36_17100 [Deltaproteobacteria bacterium]|nr:hypothetical protein [Deltaproteobacteria bacterium]